MKVVAFSDIHGDLIKHVPECDIVLIAGDITPLDIQNSVEKSIAWFYMDFLPWAEALPCKKVLFIAGNHDYWLEQIGNRRGRSAKDIMKLLYRSKYNKDNKVIYLENSWYEFEGKKFYGFPWCPVLSNWSFYKSPEDMQKAVQNIPNCDVLITHCPPKYTLQGTVLQQGWNFMNDFGCLELNEIIGQRIIQYNICGHIHSGKHIPDELHGTKVVNVSSKDEDYRTNYDVFEFEL